MANIVLANQKKNTEKSDQGIVGMTAFLPLIYVLIFSICNFYLLWNYLIRYWVFSIMSKKKDEKGEGILLVKLQNRNSIIDSISVSNAHLFWDLSEALQVFLCLSFLICKSTLRYVYLAEVLQGFSLFEKNLKRDIYNYKSQNLLLHYLATTGFTASSAKMFSIHL